MDASAGVGAGDAIEPVETGHVQVEQHEVGLSALGEREQFFAAASLADDVDVLAGLECPANPLQHERVVIRDENLQRRFHDRVCSSLSVPPRIPDASNSWNVR